MSEFDLIARYFTRASSGVELGVGDDAALLRVANGMELVVSSDMLVCGTHFFADDDPSDIGHKTLAVNLSDLAAMGAKPRWATLAISLPEKNEAWLQAFSAGFFALAERYGVSLVGGDTTRGPLNLCVTIMGEVPQGTALRRDGAGIGEDVWVSGQLGEAALTLAHKLGTVELSASDLALCQPALHRPEPRVALGLALRGLASSAIDISDGLLADLGHVLRCSGVGAELQWERMPVSTHLHPYLEQDCGRRWVLAGGDDYELCFTAPESARHRLAALAEQLALPLTRIGVIVAEAGCQVRTQDGNLINIGNSGYDHFR